ncbi:unnamed protein product [Musa acuminata subsp. malaccensis]|uniref:(wild Malaysian banana) hypothetical protein n=1 Tax=Musa acuminata subsp. malaccensis TaxID=214687 RepID=A0A804I3X3_MUSAM|nr:unnamed protein product [Musa acuminata subsp. malaccensis]
MDEIDSIGSTRMESGTRNGDSEVQRTMLELLNQLDGLEGILLGTPVSYRTESGSKHRYDTVRQTLEFPNSNEEVTVRIVNGHEDELDAWNRSQKIAEKMNGASGAELKAVCTEAGMFALRERRVHVTQEDFEMAVAKVMKKETEKNMSKLWK